MKASDAKDFMKGIKAAEIDTYSFVTDINTNLHHNESSVCVVDTAKELVYNFRESKFGGASNPHRNQDFMIMAADFADIHEFRCGASYEQILKFADAVGISLTDEDKKTLININSGNYRIIPPTGDYTFRILSQEEVEKLSPEEKENYEKELNNYNAPMAEKDLVAGSAARITLG